MTDLFMWCGELGTFSSSIAILCILFRQASSLPLTFEKRSLGDLSDVGTPGLISNPVVKGVSADGTWRATSRESRSLPRGFFILNSPTHLYFLALPL
jgi:hypothetical protein